MAKSAIEWTEETWNPIVGCSLKSPGCVHCYAMPMAARIEAINAALVAEGKPPQSPQYDGTTRKVNGNAVWTGKLAMAGDNILLAPLKRKKPTTYFVNSMGDLFHEDCPDEDIDLVLAVGAMCPHHTLQILTKRAARMHAYMTTPNRKRIIAERVMDVSNRLARQGGHQARIKLDDFSACFAGSGPFKNIWLGVSAERQQEADERIPELLRTPAAVRFISYEPALGPLDLEPWLAWPDNAYVNDKPWGCIQCDAPCDCPRGKAVYIESEGPLDKNGVPSWIHADRRTLDWIICGGESGPEARPMHPDWALSLRDQCAAANVAFFFKQWGAWARWEPRFPAKDVDYFGDDGSHSSSPGIGREPMVRVGKARAGKLLDGVAHHAVPELRGGHRARAALEVSRG